MRHSCLIHSRYEEEEGIEEGIEEGVEGVDDALIDSLIDAVYFNDLVLEKDVFDHVRYGCLQECQAQ